jgi:hypothetical protein
MTVLPVRNARSEAGLNAVELLEIAVDTDRIAHISIDGSCKLRVLLGPDAVVIIRGSIKGL